MKTAFTIVAMAMSLPVLADGEWRLAWSDEFDGPEINPAVWSFEEGWLRNREAQYYTVARKENACIEDGCLVITARKERYPNSGYDPAAPTNSVASRKEADYTSASLLSRGKFDFLYGKVEVRAKIPESLGTWPAIWTCGREHPWPKCGEIDIMEAMGCEPGRVMTTTHWADPVTGKHVGKGGGVKNATPADGFHLYGIEWDESKIDYFYDGVKCHTQDITGLTDKDGFNPFRQPHYLRLNLAFGGGWAGRMGVDDTAFPIRYEIDYIRLYKRDE